MSKFFLGRLFSSGSKVSSTIKSVKPNVPRTKSEKLKFEKRYFQQNFHQNIHSGADFHYFLKSRKSIKLATNLWFSKYLILLKLISKLQ